MTTQERIFAYFARNQRLHILFIFDPLGGICDELENEQWPEGYLYHVFDGHSWFNLKYHLENDWHDKKVVLLFKMLEPTSSSLLAEFPVADLLVANAIYTEKDYAEFIEQYGLPKNEEIQKYVSDHISDFRLKKYNEVMLPYLNRNDFTIDIINRCFISVYFGLKQVLDWDKIIARVVCLGMLNEEKKRDKFFIQLQKNQDAYDALQLHLEQVTGQKYDVNQTEKVRKVAESIKYNSIMALISEDQHDNYRQYKIKDQLTLSRFNQLLVNVDNDKNLYEPFHAAVAELARGIKEEEIIRIYGTDQQYGMMTDALCWPILKHIVTDLIPGDANAAAAKLQNLLNKMQEDAKAKTTVETVLNICRYYQNANNTGTLCLNTPDEYIMKYTQEFYLMDYYYRKSLESFYFIKAADCPLYDIILQIKKQLDIHYSQKQQELNEQWIGCLRDFGGTYDRLSASRQENFYRDIINPITTKQVVIISDALRYEVASELLQKLKEQKHIVDMSVQIAMMPTETKYCKLSLLPHNELKQDGTGMLIDNKSLITQEQRTAHMQQFRDGAKCVDFKTVTESGQDEMRELFKSPIVYVMHDKIDKEGHDQSAIEMTSACRDSITQLAALVHRIHMTFNVSDVYITADHGFLFEDKAFKEKDKHQVQEQNIEKKTRYYLTLSDTPLMGITKFNLEAVSRMVAPNVFIAIPNGTNRMMAAGGYNFAHGGGALQEIITPLIHSKYVRKETRPKVSVSLAGNTNLTLVSGMVRFTLLQNEPTDSTLRALDIKYGIFVNGVIAGSLEEKTLASPSDDVSDRMHDNITIRLASIPAANAFIELRVYDADDMLNPIISRNVKNSMSELFDEVDF